MTFGSRRNPMRVSDDPMGVVIVCSWCRTDVFVMVNSGGYCPSCRKFHSLSGEG